MFCSGREIAGLSRIVGLFSSVSMLYISVFVSKIKNTNGEMKLNITAWPRALGSSVGRLKEALLPVAQMFVQGPESSP